jgi:hypothetical protein
VHPNRALRQAGLVRVREELGRELLDGMDALERALWGEAGP